MKKRYRLTSNVECNDPDNWQTRRDQAVQLVIPLKEVVELIQRGLMNLAMSAFTQLAEQVMGCEVTALVGPKIRWTRGGRKCAGAVSLAIAW